MKAMRTVTPLVQPRYYSDAGAILSHSLVKTSCKLCSATKAPFYQSCKSLRVRQKLEIHITITFSTVVVRNDCAIDKYTHSLQEEGSFCVTM